jgi:hypothetical protein
MTVVVPATMDTGSPVSVVWGFVVVVTETTSAIVEVIVMVEVMVCVGIERSDEQYEVATGTVCRASTTLATAPQSPSGAALGPLTREVAKAAEANETKRKERIVAMNVGKE